MSKRHTFIALLAVALVLVSCGPTATPTSPPAPTEPAQLATPKPASEPSPTPADAALPEGILISELLPGIHGVDNNLEFVELYNSGPAAVDLNGWSLWYRLADNREEGLLYAWEDRADIPGQGHYLLVRAGSDVGNTGDVEYTISLFEKKGGLALRDPDGATVDTLVWGEGPSDYQTGPPAPAPEGGASLERLPGGDEGNQQATGNDAADFAFNPHPSPQNTGDLPTPLPEERLVIRLTAPRTVEPGSQVDYTIEIENLTGETLSDLHAEIPVPAGFEVISTPPGAALSGGRIEWTVTELASGATEAATVQLQSPWTYLSDLVKGYYVESADGAYRSYGPPLPVAVEGGAIPIATARTLDGETVTVEGTATMYTDGFYAGSTGTKFYVEDETGGIQVYCPGGKDLVSVEVGDRVRVTGEIEVYRDSLEIIPSTYPDDVAVLESGGAVSQPNPVTLAEATKDENLPGRLIVVEGLTTRIEEFTYSYEADLMDDEGNLLLVYVEKDTGVTTEPLDVGKLYRVTGISELYSGDWQIKPRFQTDFAEIFPPELLLEMDVRNSILPGETLTYTLTAYNHTGTPLTNLRIEATPPVGGIALAEVLHDGELEGPDVVWVVPELAGGGESVSVSYLVTVDAEATGKIVAEAATATADQWSDPVETDRLLTFVGSGVPIWAIQGPGTTSPYVRDQATTEGIVIGVFPELGGFWIQEDETDDDPRTSAGLFVLASELDIPVTLGDKVRVSGKIRERSAETLLEIQDIADVEVLSSGNLLPTAVELDPPLERADAQEYYEALEGMLAQLSDPVVAVAPTSKYGEVVLVRPEWGIERIMKGDPTGMMIFVDDGASDTHFDLSSLAFPLKTGDVLMSAEGPLAFTYDNFKIEPISLPVISPVERPLPELEPTGAGEFSIATFNVENLFDSSDPHPSDLPLPSRSQYELDLTKTANAIVAMGAPTIVGLQEVENIGILERLVEQDAIASYGYQPFLKEGTDSRGIDVAYLVRADQATVEGATAFTAPDGLTSRPPLVITATIHLEGGDQTVYVLNNHFTSMSGGEKPTEPRRKAQAAWNVTLVQRILQQDSQAHVIVLGDLNSFYDSPPLDVLREAGMLHVYEFVEPDRPYTYIFQGESETLDHILVTPSLYAGLAHVAVLHVGADYPPPIPDDPSARRVSDHDALVVIFALE
jgi:predicted extracellular nuclease